MSIRTSPDLVASVRQRLPAGSESVPAGTGPHFLFERRGSEYRLSAADRLLWRAADREEALDRLEGRLRFEVARRSREHLDVHAGAVAIAGRGVLVPGASGSGKSHLVAALLERGAAYLSDEYALIGSDGRLRPYPQPLMLAGDERARKRRVPAERFGAPGVSGSVPVTLVVATRYRAGAACRFRPITAGEAVLALLAHTVRARIEPRRALRWLARATAAASAVSGDRGAAAEAADALFQLVRSNHPHAKETA